MAALYVTVSAVLRETGECQGQLSILNVSSSSGSCLKYKRTLNVNFCSSQVHAQESTSAHVCLHTHMYTHMHKCTHRHARTPTCMHRHAHTCTYTHNSGTYMRTHNKHTCMYIHPHARTDTCTHAHVNTHTLQHAHIQMERSIGLCCLYKIVRMEM